MAPKLLKVLGITVSVVICGLMACWAIYGEGDYGLALFMLTPFVLGAMPVVVYGRKHALTIGSATRLAMMTLLIFLILLVVFAIEGLICIVMAAPFAVVFTWLGCLMGLQFVNRYHRGSVPFIVFAVLAMPLLSFLESQQAPVLSRVVTSIDIDADPETVWRNVVSFPRLDEPEEFIFKVGIAYPIDAQIEGEGVGAIRYCNFTTGSFVEPITVWDQPNLLRFDVVEQPEPMKELSFWDVDAPHLHDYFVSKQGQFLLTPLPNGGTRLEGSTWYYHNIRPTWYWEKWSNFIVGSIHVRVLEHIRREAQNQNQQGSHEAHE